MNQKAGRNDPCPCGSGRKYKICCWKSQQLTGKKNFTAKLLSGKAAQIGKAFTSSISGDRSNKNS